MELQRYRQILLSFNNNYYDNLGIVNFIDTDDMNIIKFSVKPFEGFHKDVEYIITLKFNSGWPYIFIDSNIYDQIKTKKYINGYGYHGNEHKGICIKNLSYGYSFNYFYKYCDGKWQNYIYYLITVFNNIQDFEKGSGFKSNYKNILNL
jgi:hypothetical protein